MTNSHLHLHSCFGDMVPMATSKNRASGKMIRSMIQFLKGTVSQDFFAPVFFFNQLILTYKRCPWAVLIYSEFSQSFCTFKMTPWYLGNWGVAPKFFRLRNCFKHESNVFVQLILILDSFMNECCFKGSSMGLKVHTNSKTTRRFPRYGQDATPWSFGTR